MGSGRGPHCRQHARRQLNSKAHLKGWKTNQFFWLVADREGWVQTNYRIWCNQKKKGFMWDYQHWHTLHETSDSSWRQISPQICWTSWWLATILRTHFLKQSQQEQQHHHHPPPPPTTTTTKTLPRSVLAGALIAFVAWWSQLSFWRAHGHHQAAQQAPPGGPAKEGCFSGR